MARLASITPAGATGKHLLTSRDATTGRKRVRCKCCDGGPPDPDPRQSPCCTKCPPRPMCYPLESPRGTLEPCPPTTDGVDALLVVSGTIDFELSGDQRARGGPTLNVAGSAIMPNTKRWLFGGDEPGCGNCDDAPYNFIDSFDQFPVYQSGVVDPVAYSQTFITGSALIAPCSSGPYRLGNFVRPPICEPEPFRKQNFLHRAWEDDRAYEQQEIVYGFSVQAALTPNFGGPFFGGIALYAGWEALLSGSVVRGIAFSPQLQCPDAGRGNLIYTLAEADSRVDYLSRRGCVTGLIATASFNIACEYGPLTPGPGDKYEGRVSMRVVLGLNNVAACSDPRGTPQSAGIPAHMLQGAAFRSGGCCG